MERNDWKRMVATYHGHTEAGQQFIMDVNAHISTYEALVDADRRFQDPVDTVEELQDIRNKAKELGMMLFEADRQTISYIIQGAILAPDIRMEQPSADKIHYLSKRLLETAEAINTVLAELQDGADAKRRGFHKFTPRKVFIRAICDSYQERFAEVADKDNRNFCRILEAICETKGIPRAKLSRIIEESIPPQIH